MKSRLAWFWIFLLVCGFGSSLFAQDTASITGSVTDQTGAAIPKAQVIVSNSEHGIKRTTVTNAEGSYLVSALPPGSYDLTITAGGFKKYLASGVILRVAEKARADAAMTVGAENTEVNVEGTQVAQVETQTNELAGTITGKEISQLQLNGRVFTQLVTLTPGVTNQTGSSEGQYGITASVNYSVNGGRLEYNNWELDGGDNMDNGSNSTLNVTPSIDAIGEVRVLTSNYGAQYGRNASGTIETETKSGTSHFHGDAYEFVRNDLFNATPEFQSTVPSYKKNDFGYTIGGPVYIPGHYNSSKEKTFFFWSQEWRRDRVPGQAFNVIVPSLPERSGNFSDLCPSTNAPFARLQSNGAPTQFADCPGTATGQLIGGQPSFNPVVTNGVLNQVPVNAASAPLLGIIPTPNNGANVFTASPSQPTNWREELVRVDHNFSDRLRAMFRYAHDSWDTVTAAPLWSDGTSFPTVQTNFVGPATALVARLTATASPTLLNEFVFSYTTDHIILTNSGQPNPNAWKRPANLAISSLFPNANDKGALPGFSVAGGFGGAYGSTGFSEDSGFVPNGPYNANPTYTFRDNVTKVVGQHNLQFGAYAVAAQKNELTGTVPSTNGFLTFDPTSPVSIGNPFADLLMGNIANYAQSNAQPKYYNRYKILEPYFQDDFHATKRLTLNMGLRISLFGTYRERYHQAYNFDPAAWSAAKAPVIDVDGSLTGQAGALVPGSGDPFNGMVQCGVNGVPVGCMTGKLFNPAPRLGFAWDPLGDGKWAIRGGYGIFFDHTNGNEADSEALESSPPLVQVPTQYNIAGYTSIGASASGSSLLFPLSVVSIPDHALWPNVQQWHLDVQHDVARNTVASISYVGSKGTHLGRKYELNQLQAVPNSLNPYIASNAPISAADCASTTEGFNGSGQPVATGTVNGAPFAGTTGGTVAVNLAVACGNNPDPFRPFRGIGNITRLDNGASSVYHALQAQLRRSVGSLQLNVSYTYSHSIDDASDGGVFGDGGILNAFDFPLFRASSNFDQRHTFTTSAIYDLPFFKGAGLRNKLLGGWELSGIGNWQTGTPFSAYNGASTPDNAGLGNGVASNAGAGQSFADVISNPYQNIPQFDPASGFGPFIANPNAFAQPVGLTLGNSGRNFLRNPGHWNIDMALFKHFPIKESLSFEFRAEAFNIFNHVEYGPLAGDQGGAAGSAGFSSGTGTFVPGSNFLQVGTAYSPRILQLGAKLLF